jgi:predicted nucleic acid-binding protein
VILVDTSVWVDYFRGIRNNGTEALDGLLGQKDLAIGDLILAEVLQGTASRAEFRRVRRLFGALRMVEVGGEDLAVKAAENFQYLRARGVTVRKTIDTLIATRCIEDGMELLHNDRDFEAFEMHLGLRCLR